MFKTSNLSPAYGYNNRHDKGDNPKKIGHPDKDLLDRTEAYEVVDFINSALKTWKWSTPMTPEVEIVTGSKIEKLMQQAPSNLRSRVNISQWIKDNWSKN